VKARLYLETTIPSYLVARPSRDLRLASEQQMTRDWWDGERSKFDLCISETVLLEVQSGDASFAAKRAALVSGLPILSLNKAAEELAALFLNKKIIPQNAAIDATHIAIAAAHSVEFLLTWNCKHINNRLIVRRIEQTCEESGYGCPVICTPAELLDLEI
jgi:hypothetical protein